MTTFEGVACKDRTGLVLSRLGTTTQAGACCLVTWGCCENKTKKVSIPLSPMVHAHKDARMHTCMCICRCACMHMCTIGGRHADRQAI